MFLVQVHVLRSGKIVNIVERKHKKDHDRTERFQDEVSDAVIEANRAFKVSFIPDPKGLTLRKNPAAIEKNET